MNNAPKIYSTHNHEMDTMSILYSRMKHHVSVTPYLLSFSVISRLIHYVITLHSGIHTYYTVPVLCAHTCNCCRLDEHLTVKVTDFDVYITDYYVNPLPVKWLAC